MKYYEIFLYKNIGNFLYSKSKPNSNNSIEILNRLKTN